MAQDVVVMAFRKRLKNRGYICISIKRLSSGNFLVSAVEPLAGFGVQVEMSIVDMHLSMR